MLINTKGQQTKVLYEARQNTVGGITIDSPCQEMPLSFLQALTHISAKESSKFILFGTSQMVYLKGFQRHDTVPPPPPLLRKL